jgi:hypothetical protein
MTMLLVERRQPSKGIPRNILRGVNTWFFLSLGGRPMANHKTLMKLVDELVAVREPAQSKLRRSDWSSNIGSRRGNNPEANNPLRRNAV